MIKLLNNIIVSILQKGGSDKISNDTDVSEIVTDDIVTEESDINTDESISSLPEDTPNTDSIKPTKLNKSPKQTSKLNNITKPKKIVKPKSFPFIIIVILVIAVCGAVYWFVIKPRIKTKNCGTPFKPVNHMIPFCKENCYTTSKSMFAMKSCTKNCGSEKHPSRVAIPKCSVNCYTMSNKKDALKSCTLNCGGNNKKSSLPSTKIINKNPLESCTKNCGKYYKPTSFPLPNCKEDVIQNQQKKMLLNLVLDIVDIALIQHQ